MSRRTLTLLAPLLALVVAAPARADVFGSGSAAGVRAAAPSDTALDTTLEQLTGGIDASEVTTRNECHAEPGQAACLAKTLVLRDSRERIHPRVAARKTFTQVFPTRRTGIAPATAAGAPAAVAPGAGTPAWLQQAYDLTYLSQTRGAGNTVAIVDAFDAPHAEADLATYRARYGLPPCTTANGCFKKLNQNGGTGSYPAYDQGWAQEIALDLDAVSALCPNCKIVLVEANTNYQNDLAAAIATAVASGAKQVSNSYGAAEGSQDPYLGRLFPGVALVASTGDNGTYGPGISSYPAAYPGFVAAGGTSLALSGGAPTARGFGESAWSGAGSGCNTHFGIAKPAYQTDSGCSGRSYADISAVADPNTGLVAYSSDAGGWFLVGGTSLSSPLIAAYLAVTGIDGSSPKFAYDNAALLNDPVSGSNGNCSIYYICHAATGYDGPTGAGSISGAVVSGAPGVAAPSRSSGYMQTASASTATLAAGVYPNSFDTTYFWQYGTTTSYDGQTAAAGIGNGKAPVLTTSTLTGLSASTTYHYRLVAQNSAGTTYGYDYTFTTAGAGANPPGNTAAPVVTGTAQQGQTLTATPGTWSPAATSYAYQWQRSTDGGSTWTTIAGATAGTYSPGTGDLAARLRVVVTASNSYGSTSASSAPVGPVSSGAPVNTSPPVIAGTPRRGQVLTVSSSWNPASTTAYQWQRSTDGGTTWTAIGLNSTSYTLVSADNGALVRVTVTASNVFGAQSLTSAAVGAVVADPPVNGAPPAVTGTTQRTYTLTASKGTWSGAGNTYAYQWQRSDGTGWASISGATGATYTLGVADEGDWIRVLVTATNPDGSVQLATDATPLFVAQYPPANTVAPTVSGMPQRTAVLTATRGIWTGPDNMYAYQWQRDFGEGWVDIPRATSSVYMLTAEDEFATVRVTVRATNPDGTIVEASEPTAPIQDAGPYNQTPPAISGLAQRGSLLTVSAGWWSGAGNAYAYQWQSSADGTTWTDVTGATANTYTPAVSDEGRLLRAVVTASNADGTASAASPATARVQASAPVNTARPAVSGTAQRSFTLSSTRGAWDGTGNAYAYQWQRDGVDIPDATGATYTLTVADEGAKVRVLVTATNPDGTVTAASDATATVTSAAPVSVTLPQVTGTVQRTSTLSATQGAWGGIGNAYGYQWQASADGITWANVAGATSQTYTLGVADEGKQLRMVVTATNPDGIVSAASAATAKVPSAPPVNTARPAISGGAVRSSTLTSTPGTWSGIGNAYAYQWQRDGVDIPGATDTTYTLTVADEGAKVRLVITAANPDGSVSAASDATATVAGAPPANTVRPSIAGTAQRAATLTGNQGAWSGIGNAYATQWQRSGDGVTWTDIPGATDLTYTLAPADVGAKVRLLVTASNPDATVSIASTPTATVAAQGPLNTVRPTLSGLAQRASTLIATQGTWGGAGNAYAYQWQRDGVDIAGATDTSYTLAVADENHTVRVVVTASNPDGSTSAASAASATVQAAPPANWFAPVVSGTAQRSFSLNADLGYWTGAGNSYAYRWQRNGVDIAGATDPSYVLTPADVGARVRVVVTASNPDSTVTAVSNATGTVIGAPPAYSVAPSVSGAARRTATLTADQGVWSGIGNAYAYRWQRDGVDIPGATGTTYTLGAADVGARVRLRVTASNPDGSLTAYSAATAIVQAAPPVNAAAPAVSGAALLGAQLSASTGDWTPAGATFAYQWQRNGTDIAGATSASYTLQRADAGARVRVRVTATNADGTGFAFSPATDAVIAPPSNLIAPAAPAGTVQQGATLTADNGWWDTAGATFSYTWLRCPAGATNLTAACADVGSGRTYVLTGDDVGHPLGVRVTASNAAGSSTADSGLSAPVQLLVLSYRELPTVSGTPWVGRTLSAGPGAWNMATSSATYGWLRCDTDGASNCVAVAGGDQYTLTDADAGHAIVLTQAVVASGQSATARSAALRIVAAPVPQATAAPSITGTAVRGSTLSARTGTWSNDPARFGYQWRRDGVDIPGATGSSYTLTRADEGAAITVVVSAENAAGTGTATAAPTAPVAAAPPVNTQRPVIQGVLSQGQTLTLGGAVWQATADTTYGVSWERCDAAGCRPIATGDAYTLRAADVGAQIVVVSTATNADGTVSARADRSAAVQIAAPRWNSLPTVSSAPGRVGDVLSIAAGTWTGPALTGDATQMMRCTNVCTARGPANSGSYTIASGDLGAILRVRETALNAGGDTVVWSARYVGPVLNAQSAAAVLKAGTTQLKNAKGTTVAVAVVAKRAVAASAKKTRTAVTVRRARGVKGKLVAWACPAKLGTGAPRCSAKVSLRRAAKLRLPATGRLRVVVVRANARPA